MIKKAFKRYVDDGFILWPSLLDIDILIDILNKLHKSIKYTVEKGNIDGTTQTINMLDVKVILHQNTRIETEIYYKTTNNHHYLEYGSFHPEHIKNNIPYTLAKRVIVFTSDSNKEKTELNKLRKWLTESNYPTKIIDKAFHNAKLQGPAPNPKEKKELIPLISTYCSNYSNKSIIKEANLLLENCPDEETKKCFKNKKVILAFKQPPNLMRQLTSAKFDSSDKIQNKKGIFKCKNPNCKICKLYLVECTSFKTAKGVIWEVPTFVTCNSKMVLYYQICMFCKTTSNIGKTNDLRLRTNNHISACRLGNSTDKFDNHVYHCNREKKMEPYFKLMVLMEINDMNKLLVYENHLHKNGHDTINRTVAKISK